MKKSIIALLLLLAAGSALASAGGGTLERAATDVNNRAALQRGAKLFISYCMGCHSAQYMRYSRLMQDLGLTETQVKENFIYNGGKITDKMTISMRPGDGGRWFGVVPPDLSLTGRSRGVDWIYTYLKSFYPDPKQANGWNNTVFPGVSMPNVLWELQGFRTPIYETQTDDQGAEHEVLVGWNQVTEGLESEQDFERTARDLTTFLEYLGEPARLQRESMGVWVLLYLALFTVLAYFLKLEYWRDVH
jgi:ubiquinol-cytochrome c reductase cytochrome c1 subunit